MRMLTALRFVVVASTGLGMSACGGDGFGGDTKSAAMVIGQEYAASRHDRVVTTGPEAAEISIRHEQVTDLRHVTLLSGSADLLR